MSKKPRPRRPHGQIRQSQIITTFGPGAMMDLPNYSVLLAGLDYWCPPGEEVPEPRLTEKLCRLLGLPSLLLREPPPDQDDPTAHPQGSTHGSSLNGLSPRTLQSPTTKRIPDPGCLFIALS